jgi:hypothetical protein
MPGWAKGCLLSAGLVAILGVLGIGCLAVVANDVSEDTDRAAEETTTTGADEPEGESTTVPPSEAPEATCAYAGTGDFGNGMQVELTFTNPLGEVNWLGDVTYALTDGEGGTRFFTDSAFSENWDAFPMANEQFRVIASPLEQVPPGIDEATIGCTVLGIEEASFDLGGYQRASDTDTCTVLGTDPSGLIQVEVAVTSPYDETTNLQVWWALYAPGQVRFDADTDVTDLVGAGESYRIPTSTVTKPEWIGDGEVTCKVVGFWDNPL